MKNRLERFGKLFKLPIPKKEKRPPSTDICTSKRQYKKKLKNYVIVKK